MRFLVFDFETSGIGVDKRNKYEPYPPDRMPLPRANFPIQVAAQRLDANGVCERSWSTLVFGVERMDPWVEANCPHLSVQRCAEEGVSFETALVGLANVAGMGDRDRCALVAHNLSYDWNEVIVRTATEMGLTSHPAYTFLQSLPRLCTCVNADTKRDGTAYYFARIGKWIGPKLSDLAKSCGVDFEEDRAHDAEYDVSVTAACWRQKLLADAVSGAKKESVREEPMVQR